MHIAIVTTQLPDLTDHGGISNPTFNLALGLQNSGHSVTLIVGHTEKRVTTSIKLKYKSFGLSLIEINIDHSQISPWWLAFQYEVYFALSDIEPDVVIGQEWSAPLAMYAKFNKKSVPVITYTHGGTYYLALGDERNFHSSDEIMVAALEDIQLSHSELVISPSKYLLDLYKSISEGITNSKVIPYFLPPGNVKSANENLEADTKICLAFIGSLSMRKGFDLFVTYVLGIIDFEKEIVVRVYGKYYDIELQEIRKRLSKLNIDFKFEHKMDTDEIFAELADFNTTVIVPSRLDNSPGVIYEAISNDIKVLTSEFSGGLELNQFSPTGIHLLNTSNPASNLAFIRSNIKPHVNQQYFNKTVLRSWLTEIEQIIQDNDISGIGYLEIASTEYDKKISVIIATKDRGEFLIYALDSIAKQNLLPWEVIIIDDASDETFDYEALINKYLKYFEIRIHRNEKNIGQAKCRNLGSSMAKSDYLSFLDDDVIFLPNHLEECLRTLIDNDAAAVTSFMLQTYSDTPLNINSPVHQIGIFAGSHFGALGELHNVVCDTHILIRKSVF
jgi:hypothetical protein